MFYSARRIGEMDVEIEESETSLGFCKSNLNEQKLINIWNRMKEYKPVWINAQLSELFLLCKTIERNNLDMIPTLRYIESTGEMLFPNVRRRSSAFGHQTLPDIIPQDQHILKCNYQLY